MAFTIHKIAVGRGDIYIYAYSSVPLSPTSRMLGALNPEYTRLSNTNHIRENLFIGKKRKNEAKFSLH